MWNSCARSRDSKARCGTWHFQVTGSTSHRGIGTASTCGRQQAAKRPWRSASGNWTSIALPFRRMAACWPLSTNRCSFFTNHHPSCLAVLPVKLPWEYVVARWERLGQQTSHNFCTLQLNVERRSEPDSYPMSTFGRGSGDQVPTPPFDMNRLPVHNVGVVGPGPQTRLAQQGSTYHSRPSAQVSFSGVVC